jgi:Type IV secretion-system coupling protein DNA-binding domain
MEREPLGPVELGRTEEGVLALSRGQLAAHKHIMGLTGMGKSRLVQSYFLQLLERGIGVGLIDPHRDLAQGILETLAATGFFRREEAYRRLIYLDFGRPDPIPFNVLRVPGSAHDVAYAFVEAVKRAWPGIADGSAPLLEQILLAGTLALVEAGEPITRLSTLLTDEDARAAMLTRVKEPYTVAFFRERFARWGPRAAQMAESTLRRLFLLTFMPELRGPLGQLDNCVRVGAFLDRGVSVIYDLGGVRNPEARRLLGCLLTVSYELAALNRATVPAPKRRQAHLIIDEFAEFLGKSGSALEQMLATARKFGLSLTLVHQTFGQAPRSLQDALQNCHVKVLYRLGPADAAAMAPTVVPGATAADRQAWSTLLQSQGRREAVVVRSGYGPVRMQSINTPDYHGGSGRLAEVLAEYGRRYHVAEPRPRPAGGGEGRPKPSEQARAHFDRLWD